MKSSRPAAAFLLVRSTIGVITPLLKRMPFWIALINLIALFLLSSSERQLLDNFKSLLEDKERPRSGFLQLLSELDSVLRFSLLSSSSAQPLESRSAAVATLSRKKNLPSVESGEDAFDRGPSAAHGCASADNVPVAAAFGTKNICHRTWRCCRPALISVASLSRKK
ncbi:hypothetical protein D1B33_03045 [Lysinibacillus yapensis]|uniref:Uncharacterized protein n=1 Tax=Ureibacillus yapensis TaxID=2304605 RepID=A0A396SEU3_9BACL|nr:hypothetical protein D1B33_03045 [Lysinibacillus yapensis]